MQDADTLSGSPQDDTATPVECFIPIDEARKAAPTNMSDAEREQHIRDCGRLMEQAMRHWRTYCDPAFHAEAHGWKRLMYQAIKSRPGEYVICLEAKRGLY
jgi:hypothetical protein